MRGMRKWKRWAVFLLLFVVLAVGGSRTAQAEMLNMTDFQDNNGTITVTKVPRGKAGNKISIKMTIHNTAEKGDNSFKTIRLANAYEYERFMTDSFGESDDEGDSGDLYWYDKSFPFEADSNTFKNKAIDIKPGSSKSVTLTYNCAGICQLDIIRLFSLLMIV